MSDVVAAVFNWIVGMFALIAACGAFVLVVWFLREFGEALLILVFILGLIAALVIAPMQIGGALT